MALRLTPMLLINCVKGKQRNLSTTLRYLLYYRFQIFYDRTESIIYHLEGLIHMWWREEENYFSIIWGFVLFVIGGMLWLSFSLHSFWDKKIILIYHNKKDKKRPVEMGV